MQDTDVTRGPREHAGDAGAPDPARRRRSCGRYDPDVPRIEAVPGELNQVWTNLIDNALDAMDGDGTLRVSAAGPTPAEWWSRSPTPAPACRPRSRDHVVRAVLHHQGRRQGHRPRSGHLPADRRRPARRRDHHRVRAGPHGDQRPAAAAAPGRVAAPLRCGAAAPSGPRRARPRSRCRRWTPGSPAGRAPGCA